jgi:hypothetical protein
MKSIEMHSMPFESLDKMFHHLCLNGPLPLRHVLRVSRVFYCEATYHAHLWSSVSPDVQSFDHFNRPYKRSGCHSRQISTSQWNHSNSTENGWRNSRSFGTWNIVSNIGLSSADEDSEPHTRLRPLTQICGNVDFQTFQR